MCIACLSKWETFLRGIMSCAGPTLTAPWKPADMSAIPRRFLFMPTFPSGWRKIRVAPFHTAAVENADRYPSVCISHQIWWPQQRPCRHDLLTFHNQVIPPDHVIQQLLQPQILTWKCSIAKTFSFKCVTSLWEACSWWSLIGWTPSVVLFTVTQFTPQLKAHVLQWKWHTVDLFLACTRVGCFLFLSKQDRRNSSS